MADLMLARYRKYDRLWIGILSGFIVPIAWYFLMLGIYDALEKAEIIPEMTDTGDFRQRTSALIGICFNIAVLQIFRIRYMYRAMQGVVFPTIVLVGIWLYFFAASVL